MTQRGSIWSAATWRPPPRPMHEQLLEKVESLLLAEALRRSGGKQTHALALLGLARPTLHDKLKKYGLRDPARPIDASTYRLQSVRRLLRCWLRYFA